MRARGEDQSLAEDIAHIAALRWLEVANTEDGAKSYLRRFILRHVHNLHREGEDVATRHPAPLDAPLGGQE